MTISARLKRSLNSSVLSRRNPNLKTSFVLLFSQLWKKADPLMALMGNTHLFTENLERTSFDLRSKENHIRR